MLSDELREALGGAEEAELVVESKRSKKRGREQDKANVPSELVDRHMYHSSKEKRRLEQITKRKEKEARRGEFLAVLKDNEILPEHRDLLISGKELGQMHTVKNRLKMVLKRYKAGLTLTDAERELLFPNGERIAELDDIDMEALSAGAASGHEQGPDFAGGGGGSEGTLIDLFAVCAPQSNDSEASSSSSSSKIKTKGTGKAKKSSDGDVLIQASEPKVAAAQPLAKAPALSKADVASTAQSLVAQLQLLKSTLKASASASAVDKGEDGSEIPQSVGEAEVTLRRYIPVPIVLPHCFDHAMPLAPIPAAAGSTTAAAASTSSSSSRFMAVERPPGVQEARLALPVCGMEQEVVEAILQYDTVIVCGETGSGKSTQVPQFCYENGFAREGLLIGVTQPRRVAAVTTADRVSFEMGDGTRQPGSRLVGYQIRHDNSTGASTAIKFMTDGILLQELEQDLLLRRYSVVLIDEAHERGVNSDVLLGLLSRAVPLRRQRHEQESALYARLSPEERTQFLPPLPPLKLVIMSATLRVEDFGSPRLFPGGAPPVVRVEARQFPVTVHFSRTTQTSHHRGAYLDDAVKKVRQIHSRLPPGGILVFLTGKREIAYAVKRLRRALSEQGSSRGSGEGEDEGGEGKGKTGAEASAGGAQDEGEWGFGEEGGSDGDSDSDSEDILSGPENDDKDVDEADFEADVAEDDGTDKSTKGSATHVTLPATAVPAASSGNADADTAAELRSRMLQAAVLAGPEGTNNSAPDSAAPDATQAEAQTQTPPRLRIVPLYAMLSAMQQREAFRPVDATLERLVVVATNVAETSITIPGIRYVVDAGREKRRVLMSAGPEQGGARVVSRFEVGWVSQASAEQRKGRAGRTGPGHCYRLYSAAFFDAHMAAFSEPQIRTVPLESLVLKMKAIGIRDILAFPFPTPPPAHAMRQAVQALQNIGAVAPEGQGQGQGQQQLTLLGKRISKFALPPRLAKVLVWAATHCRAAREALAATSVLSKDEDNGVGGADAKRARMKRERELGRESERAYLSARELLEHALGLVSVLADKSPFLRLAGRLQDGEGDEDGDGEGGDAAKAGAGAGDKERRQEREKQLLWVHRDGDALARFRAFGAYCFYRGRDLGEDGSKGKGKGKSADVGAKTAQEIAAFCATHSLSEQALARAFSMRQQLARQLALSDSEREGAGPGTTDLEQLDRAALESAAGPPSSAVETALLQLLLSAHGDQLARRAPLGAVSVGSRRQRLTAYLCTNPEVREPLYLHPHSCLYSSDPAAPLPEWVVFDGLVRNEAHTTTYMECTSVVNPGWAAEALGDCPLLQFGPLLETPMPFFDRAMDCVLGYSLPALGAHKWSLAPVQLPLSHPAFSSASADAQQAGSVGGVPGLRACDLEYRWFARLLLEGRVPLSLSVSLQGVLGRDALCDAPSALTSGKPIPKVRV